MIGRIVEIAQDYRYLSVYRGFLIIEETRPERKQVGKVPLDDIHSLIINSHGVSFSANLAVVLGEKSVPIVFCGPNHQPVSYCLPLVGNHEQTKRINAQAEMSGDEKLALWTEVVRAKIGSQAALLKALGKTYLPLIRISKKVSLGDPSNCEAQAAKAYWKILFGTGFKRDKALSGINSLLNYGYTILRSTVLRSIVSVGLHPSLGIHHRNAGNPMCLADDLMEPYRPLIDHVVFNLSGEPIEELTSEHKRALVSVMHKNVRFDEQVVPVSAAIERNINSFCWRCIDKSTDVDYRWVTQNIG